MGFFFTTITDDDMPDLAGLLVNSCAPVSTKRRLALSAACDGGDISFDSGGERIQLSIDFTSIRTRQRRHWAPCLQRRAAKWAIGMFDIPERRAFMRWSHLARRNILPLHVGLFLSFFLSFFARRMIRDWVTGASGVKRWLTRRTCVYFSLSLSDYLGLLSRLQ